MLRTYLSLFAIFALAALLAGLIGARAALEIEAETGNRAAAALSADGRGWARAEVDGAALRLTGEAASDEDRAAALRAAAAAAPWAAVADDATTRPRPAVYRPPASLELMRGVGDVVIAGAAPGAAALDALEERFREAAPGLSVTVLARDDAAPAPIGDLGAAAADIAVDLLHGRVTVAPGAIAAAGLTDDEAAMDRIDALLDALAASGVDVTRALIAPPPDVAAFALRAVMDATGGALLDCAAPTEAAAAALLKEASAIFLDAPQSCRVGAGAPDERWTEAAAVAMRSLSGLPAGRISLVGRRARLTAAPPTRLRQIEEARDVLKAALPEPYRVAVLAAPAAIEARRRADAAASDAAQETRLIYDGATLRFEGAAPSAALAKAVEAFARARLPQVEVESALALATGLAARDWRAAVTSTLSLLARLERGAARLDRSSLAVDGDVEDAGEIRALHALAVAAAGEERRALTRFRVPVAARAAAAPTPISRCVAALNAIVAETPVAFEPGSTEVGDENADIIAALAAALRPCRGGDVEIGGHTDSQGSARLNLGLSRARAFAVMDALTAAGADPRRLSARGYGEERPIADNGTESGRARNRRIEFAALTGDEED